VLDDGEARELPSRLEGLLDAMDLWRRGCAAPRGLELFRRAAGAAPAAKLYPMSAVLALVAEDRWAEADELFLSIRSDWQRDPRFPSISATLGIARGDLREAESWLRASLEDLAEEFEDPLIRRVWNGEIDLELVGELKAAHPDTWAELIAAALTSEQKYYVLLWQHDHEPARTYASRMAARFRKLGLPAGAWLEREADAAFYAGDYEGARKLYEKSLAESEDETSALLKLSDVHFKLGNLDLERKYRERIYGSLRGSDER
jgi:tetratricopeptide (TPR) repeat protein